jgi:phenylalanine-4-hydroxylase
MLQNKIETDAGAGPRWQDYAIPQCWEEFTAADHRVWDILYARQVEVLGGRIVQPFLEGLDLLDLGRPGIPNLAELNARLEPRTGWRTVAVPGLVPDEVFFAMLSERRFPVGNFIRTFDQLDYLEEPDLFHDIFGHVPLLSHAGMAAIMEHVGHVGLEAIAGGRGELVARLYWHTVEFGLAREGGDVKILGAGLASSFGESRFSLESGEVERPRFTIAGAMATPYRHDAFQPLYMVADSLDAVTSSIAALTFEELTALAD